MQAVVVAAAVADDVMTRTGPVQHCNELTGIRRGYARQRRKHGAVICGARGGYTGVAKEPSGANHIQASTKANVALSKRSRFKA